MICLEHNLCLGFWLKSLLLLREIEVKIDIFENIVNLTPFFNNVYCKVGATLLDIESKYSIEKTLS